FVYSPTTQLFSGSFTIVNPSNFVYQGPVYLIFNSIPAGVTLFGATGLTPSGLKYIKISNGLTPFSSFHITLTFKNPNKVNLGTYFNSIPMSVTGVLL